MTNRHTQRTKGLGVLLCGLSQTIEREKPDFLLVVGDREESIAAALAGNYMNVLVGHIGGGDPVYSNADDPVRFAVSKLAHIHFAIAKEHKNILLKIGEEPFRVFWTGNPSLDNIKHVSRIPLKEISKKLKFDINDGKYVVLINHPLSSEEENSTFHMRIILKSLDKLCKEKGLKVIGIYPNTDPGAMDILKVMDEFKKSEHIKYFKTLPRKIFVNLMRNALALVGNSSMGILEAPFYKLPVVNVGKRQSGRLNAGNVEFVTHDKKKIRKALQKASFDEKYRRSIKTLANIYGNGNSAEKIKKILHSIKLKDKKWYTKKKLC